MRHPLYCTFREWNTLKRLCLLCIIALLSTAAVFSQKIKVTNYDGGSVVTELGYGIKVNGQSTLMRSWVVLNDSGCPIQLGRSGIKTIYGDREYNYIPEVSISTKEKVAALDIRFLLYDVFGDHIKTILCTQVMDIQSGTTNELKNIGNWRALENEISGLLTVVSFVAQVRTSSGIAWKFNAKLIDAELSKIKLMESSGFIEPGKIK
jgi:hypothetical protein